MKAKILKGIRHRIQRLEEQRGIAFDSDLEYILQDTESKLDELYTLEEWINELDDDKE
jgi:hypothetical protein